LIRKIGIVVKPGAEPKRLDAVLTPLVNWLEQKNIEYVLEPDLAQSGQDAANVEDMVDMVDLFLGLGGDGTVLSIARRTAAYSIPVLAVNLGGLGFITEIKAEEMLPTLEQVIAGNYDTEKRMMLDVRLFNHRKQEVARACGLNDVAVRKTSESRLIELDIYVDNQCLTTYAADGLLVATPTGSTAYSLSAGGPIVHPQMNALIITPICPHTLTNRPVIVDSERVIRVVNASATKQVNLTVDGQLAYDLSARGEVEIRQSEHSLTLVVSPYKDYFAVLREKLRWSGRP